MIFYTFVEIFLSISTASNGSSGVMWFFIFYCSLSILVVVNALDFLVSVSDQCECHFIIIGEYS